MARPLRIEYPGAYYHVMNRGLSRRAIFLEEKGRERFLDLLSDIAQLWKIEIYAYCLMDNHYHLLFQTPKGDSPARCDTSMGSTPRGSTEPITETVPYSGAATRRS